MMKKVLLSLFALSFYIFGLAQTNKIEVVCQVNRGQISYGGMDKILPDSVKNYFVQMDRKEESRFGDLAIVNILTVNGWTLVSSFDSLTVPVYVLKRDFLFSNKDYQVVLKTAKDWLQF